MMLLTFIVIFATVAVVYFAWRDFKKKEAIAAKEEAERNEKLDRESAFRRWDMQAQEEARNRAMLREVRRPPAAPATPAVVKERRETSPESPAGLDVAYWPLRHTNPIPTDFHFPAEPPVAGHGGSFGGAGASGSFDSPACSPPPAADPPSSSESCSSSSSDSSSSSSSDSSSGSSS